MTRTWSIGRRFGRADIADSMRAGIMVAYFEEDKNTEIIEHKEFKKKRRDKFKTYLKRRRETYKENKKRSSLLKQTREVRHLHKMD
jgi:hypothetical protein